jgi:uncharacterized membrane protein YjgN (DUF898 family)
LVTFGLYYPWAKVRKLRYFYGNTVVGEHPLDFHGDPKRMLRGFVLVGGLLLLYSIAGKLSPSAGLSLSVLLLFPLLWWLLKKYQHDHYALGQVRTQLRAGAGSFYGVFLKTIGVGMLAALVVGIVATVIGGGVLAAAFSQSSGRPSNVGAAVVAVFIAAIVVFAIVQLLVHPYFTSRLQNLLWNRTKATQLRFESALRYWPLVGLTLKNWLLVVITLGLYWPFAAMRWHACACRPCRFTHGSIRTSWSTASTRAAATPQAMRPAT